MIRRAVFAAFVLILAFSAAAVAALTFPTLSGRVVDDAGILDASTREELTQTLAALEAKTTDQLVVVTLKSLQGTSIEDYGYQLGRTWQIGQKGKNNGILLIVVPSERRVRIEVGYGLEGVVTDAVSRLVIENAIIPRFKAGDFPGGIKNGVARLIQTLSSDGDVALDNTSRLAGPNEGPPESLSDTGSDDDGEGWTVATVILGIVLLLIFCALVSGLICEIIFQILFSMAFSGGGSSSGGGGGGGFSGGGGSFGGGGASGSW